VKNQEVKYAQVQAMLLRFAGVETAENGRGERIYSKAPKFLK
jgi:hypothetical protein